MGFFRYNAKVLLNFASNRKNAQNSKQQVYKHKKPNINPIMGSQPPTTQTTPQFNIKDWSQIPQNTGFHVLAHRSNPNIQIQQHELFIRNKRDLRFLEQIFSMRRADPCLVSAVSYWFKEVVEDQYVGIDRGSSGVIYTERILYRLPQISPVPFPDCLHILTQVIYGCTNLSKYFGYFKINPYCIGINTDNVAKVWHNANFAEIHPQQMVNTEEEMILAILDAVEPFVDFQTMPRQEPSFKYFVLKRVKQKLGFEVLKANLYQFGRYFCQGNVPNKISLNIRPQQPNQIRQNYPISNNSIHPNNSNNNLLPPPNLRSIYQIPTNNHFPIQQNIIKPLVFSRQSINYQPYRHSQHVSQHVQIPPSNIIYPQQPQQQQQNPHFISNPTIQPFRNLNHIPNNQIPINIINFNQNNYSPHPHPQNIQPIHNFRPNSSYNPFRPHSLVKSNVSQSSQKRSYQSERIQINEKPRSTNLQYNTSHTNSHQFLHFNNNHRQLVNFKQRSQSDLKNQKFPIPISFVINNNTFNNGNNNVVGSGLVRPIQIKQSIQGIQYRNKSNINNRPSSQTVPIINYQNKPNELNNHIQLNIPRSLNSSLDFTIPKTISIPHSPKFPDPEPQPQPEPQTQNVPQKDPWQTIMKVVKSKPHPEKEQPALTTSQIISPRPQINIGQDDDQLQNQKLDVFQIPRPKPKVTFDVGIPNESSLSQLVSSNHSNQGIKNLYDAKESQSIDNSSRNFYNNFEGDEFSQLAESNNPWDFTLNKKKAKEQNKQEENTQINRFKIKDQFTSLDFMKKLRVTQTIRKDDYDHEEDEDEKLKVSSEDQKFLKQRSRSREFNKEIQKLGFNMNFQEENEEVVLSTNRKNKQIRTEKELTQEWTPSYKERYQSESTIINTNQNYQPKEPSYNDKYSQKINEYSFETKYPQSIQLESFSRPNYQEYKFQWDPELLADISSKAYVNSVID